MNNIWKRSLSLVLALVMVIGLCPVKVFAVGTEYADLAQKIHEYLSNNTTVTPEVADKIASSVDACVKEDGTLDNSGLVDVAKDVYDTVLKPEVDSSATEEEKAADAANKMDVVSGIVDILKEEDVLDTSDPNVDTALKIYDDLTATDEKGENLIPDKVLVEVVKDTVDALTKEDNKDEGEAGDGEEGDDTDEDEKAEEDIFTTITNSVVDKILKDETIPAENKITVLDKVSDTLVDSGVPKLPDLTVINEINKALEKKGLLTGDDANKLIAEIADVLLTVMSDGVTEQVAVDVVKDVYSIVFNKPGQTVKQKVQICVTVCEVLYEKGYFDAAYEKAYEYAGAKGYIDRVTGKIDAVIAKLEAMKLPNKAARSVTSGLADYVARGEMTQEFAEKLDAVLDEAIETLNAGKALLTNADKLDAETKAALKDTLKAGAEVIARLLDLLKQAGKDVVNLAIIPELIDTFEQIQKDLIALTPLAEELLGEAINEATKWMKEQLKDTYFDLVDALAAAIAEHSNMAAKIVKNYLTENANVFFSAGKDLIKFAAENIEEIAAIVDYIMTNYGQDVLEIVLDSADKILDEMVDLLKEFGNDAWDKIDDCLNNLLNLGEETFDALKEALIGLRGEMHGHAKDIAKIVLNNAKENMDGILAGIKKIARETLDQMENADAGVRAKLQAILDATDALEAALKKVAKDSIYDSADEIKHAYNDLKTAIKNAAGDLPSDVLNELTNLVDEIGGLVDNLVKDIDKAILDVLKDSYGPLVDAIIDMVGEMAEDADEWLYDWFYNHPAQVIAFVNEYGDEAVDFLKEYVEEAAVVMGYILYAYGEDIAEFVMNNANEILAQFTKWYEAHGEETWEMIKVYLDELGILEPIRDAVDEIEGAVEDVQDIVEKLAYALGMLNEDTRNDLIALCDVVKVELKSTANKLVDLAKREMKAFIETEKPAIEAKLKELKAQLAQLEKDLAALEADLDNATAEEKAAVKADIAELKQFIEDVKAQIYKLQNRLAELPEKLMDLYNAAEALVDALEKLIKEGLDAAKKDVKNALNGVIDASENVVGVLSESAAQEMDAIIDEMKANLIKAYKDKADRKFAYNCASTYVALGDKSAMSASYADMLAEALDIDYTNLADGDGMESIQDTYAVIENVKDADLITLGYTISTFAEQAIADALKVNTKSSTKNWDAYLTAEGVAYVEKILAAIEDKLIEAGLDEKKLDLLNKSYADLLLAAVESYAYSVASYICELPDLADEILEKNPDALLVIVGMHNPLEKVVIEAGDVRINIGDYMDYLIDATRIHGIAYAMNTERAIYVDAPEVLANSTVKEIEIDELSVAKLGELLSVIVQYPTEPDHEYIKNRILDAVDVTDVAGHIWGEWEVTKAATVEEEGEETRTCARCGEIETRSIDKLDTKPTEATEPEETTTPVEPEETTTPVEPEETTTPVEPEETTAPVEPEETTAPVEPEDPTCPDWPTCPEWPDCPDIDWPEFPDIEWPTEPEPEEKMEVIRISGHDRTETAREVADELKLVTGAEKFDTIVYANGDVFADALTGSYLANVENAPVLLYRPGETAKNLEYIKANLAKDGVVYMLGGTAAIPATVEKELTAAGIEVERLYGRTRFETNLEILAETGYDGGETVLVVTGWEAADCLSASALGMPILLIDKSADELLDDQVAYLKSLATKSDFVIVGGETAVSTDVAKELASYDIDGEVERLKGRTRYETSIVLAETYFDTDAIVLAYGWDFADALCGGTLAHTIGAPIVLADAEKAAAVADYTKAIGVTSGYVMGGTARLTDATVRTAFNMAKDDVITVK